MDNLLKETRIIFYKSSGPGGQRKNKKSTAVRLIHKPTGIKAIATEHRLQSDNIKLAFHRLQRRLKQLLKRPNPRIPTKTSFASVERRIKSKKSHSQIKSSRRKVDLSEELF